MVRKDIQKKETKKNKKMRTEKLNRIAKKLRAVSTACKTQIFGRRLCCPSSPMSITPQKKKPTEKALCFSAHNLFD